jgi:hypothetical protein
MTPRGLQDATDEANSRQQAVSGWALVSGQDRWPTQVQLLKPLRRKSVVYRLVGAGPAGSSVIAKRTRAVMILKERILYEDYLPSVPVSSPRYLGWASDADPDISWLFLEAVGDRRYDARDAPHRRAAARWLALFHVETSLMLPDPRLPERGTAYYLDVVRSARQVVLDCVDNPAFTSADLRALEQIARACDRLDAHQGEIRELCGLVPPLLVHGDFGAKNVRVRQGVDSLDLVPLDWELAGWGTPAADLSQVDLDEYWSIVRDAWPTLRIDLFRRFACLGRAFWSLAGIPGEASSLAQPWVSWVMNKLMYYHAELEIALGALGWVEAADSRLPALQGDWDT